MSEYIERELVIRAVKWRFSVPVENLIVEVIGDIPAADVEPVVRCRDCKYWHRAILESEDGSPVDFGICDFMKDDIDTDEKDFCSRGEKA